MADRPSHLVVVRLALRVPPNEQSSPSLVFDKLQKSLADRYEIVESRAWLEPDDGRASSRAATAQGDSGAVDLRR